MWEVRVLVWRGIGHRKERVIYQRGRALIFSLNI